MRSNPKPTPSVQVTDTYALLDAGRWRFYYGAYAADDDGVVDTVGFIARFMCITEEIYHPEQLFVVDNEALYVSLLKGIGKFFIDNPQFALLDS